MSKKVTKVTPVKKGPRVVEPVEEVVSIEEETVKVETDTESVTEPENAEESTPEPEEQISPEEMLLFRNNSIRRYLTFQVIDNLSALINNDKMQLVYAIANLLSDEKRDEIIRYTNNTNPIIMIESYETIEASTSEDSNLSKYNAIMYHILSAAKEAAKGFEDNSIEYEIISLPNYGNRIIVIYREADLMQIGASDKVLEAIDPKCIAAVAITPSHINNILINLVLNYIAAWIPQLKEDETINEEEILTQFIDQYGGMIIGYILLAMERSYSMIVTNAGGEFESIAGGDYRAMYSYHCDINSSSPDAISVVSIYYEGASGNKLLDAIRQG